MMYLADESDDATIYVFASKAGAPTNPDWYYNLVERRRRRRSRCGTETYDVTRHEVDRR